MDIEIDDNAIMGTCDLHPEYLKKDICMEECAELIQAISKKTRDFISREDDVAIIARHTGNEVEEIADVLIAIKYLMYYDRIDPTDIQEWVDYKQKRQMIRDYDTFHKKYGTAYFESGMASNSENYLEKYYFSCKKEATLNNNSEKKEVRNENELHENKA